MEGTHFAIAIRLTDDELLQRVQVLASEEREVTVELVAHLVVLDSRRLHLAQGYGSLFSYCTEALRLSEHAAYNRIEAARASRRFPGVLDRLADGSLNLSTLRLLAPHLTPENHQRVLEEAAGKSKREVEALVARLAPRPDVGAYVRKLPPARMLTEAPAASSALVTAAPADRGTVDAVAPSPAACAPVTGITDATEAIVAASDPAGTTALRTLVPGVPGAGQASLVSRPQVTPLAPERYRVQFTVGRETHENLRRAQEFLRREVPDGDPGAIFDRALKLLLEDVARKKLAATSQPRRVWPTARGSRHIPAHVRRAVWLRDAGHCAFVARSGRRCRERAFLELHHVDPYAMGGETNVANLSLRCRAHNAYEAELVFGRFASPAREERRQELHRDDRPHNSPRGESKARHVVVDNRPKLRSAAAAAMP
jgi:hypothetical protein